MTDGDSVRLDLPLIHSARRSCAGVALALSALAAAGLHAATVRAEGVLIGAALLLAVFGWIWHALSTHLPHRRFGLANTLTLLRAGAMAVLAALAAGEAPAAMSGNFMAALALSAIATDGLDGWIARRSGTVSSFGARFDMEVDALSILVLSAALVAQGRVDLWVLASGLLRYGFGLAGWLWPWLQVALPARERRRAICAALGLCLALALSPALPVAMATGLAALGLCLVVYSFAADTVWLYLRHKRRLKARPEPLEADG